MFLDIDLFVSMIIVHMRYETLQGVIKSFRSVSSQFVNPVFFELLKVFCCRIG